MRHVERYLFMPNFGKWLAGNRMDVINPEERAVLCWKRIQDRPISITIIRSGAQLAAQTVRLEYEETANYRRTEEVTKGADREVWVIGVAGHPDEAVVDTNIQPEDLFNMNYQQYRVMDVVPVPGEVQVRCQRIS